MLLADPGVPELDDSVRIATDQRAAFLPAVHQGTFISDKVERPDQVIGKDFDPKKLVSFMFNEKHSLPEQRRELERDQVVRVEQPAGRAEHTGGEDAETDAAPSLRGWGGRGGLL